MRLADYTAILKLIVKVLDFVQCGGPECTVGGTVFEMWLGHYEPSKARGPEL